MQAKTNPDATQGLNRSDERILLLCHRIPYPPDKGDKIRSKRWLDALAARYRVHLGAFVDDARDWRHADQLRAVCEEVKLVGMSNLWAKLRGSPALIAGESLSSACYRDKRMTRWVRDLLRSRDISRVIVYSSAMAQYATVPEAAGIRKVIDFVDVDADKWRQYARRVRWPMSAVYGLEARRLLAHDTRAAQDFDASIFVSQSEAELFQRQTGVNASIFTVPNGVDTEFFAPSANRSSLFSADERPLVFTGAMDYWANVDAVVWFVTDVWPILRAKVPAARLHIVGSRPAKEVCSLAAEDVVVTGRVPDVRPYLQHAAAVIAPMRIARGVQNKVLEGMAMAQPVLTTSMGAEGLEAVPGDHLLVEDEPAAFAARLEEMLRGGYEQIGDAAREFVRERYDWRSAMADFLSIVDGAETPLQVVV